MKNQQKKPLIKKQPMLVLSLAVFILIISGGYFYYRYEKKIIRQEQYSNLKTIADLKINQILHWREDRLADAQVIAESPFIRQNFQRWLLSQDSTLGKDLLDRFALLRYNYKYEDVIIVSDGGKLLLGLNTNSKHIDSETIDYCKKALQDKKAFLSDFYFSPAHDTIRFDIFAPILNNGNVAVAVLVLRVNPYGYLYPLIQSWPTSSKSAETLIIRRDGDSILYENELRHISNTALKLRIPLTSIKVPSVQAVLGHIGIFEGLDYRGVRVLADIRPVPGTPWFMIAKVDQSEIFSELKYRTVIVIIITLLLLLFFGIGISWLYNNRQKNIYRKLLESGAALEESEVKYRSLFENAEVGMYRSKLDGTAILAVNGKLCNIFGYTESEMLENPATICWADADARSAMVENLRKDGFLSDYEIDILTKNSEIRTLTISVNLYPDQGYLEGSAVDITERKQAEKVIRDNEKRFRELIESLPQLFWTCRVDGPCDYLSRQWVEYTGVSEEDQLGYRWLEQLHPEDKDRTVSEWMEKVKTGNSFDIEFRIRRNDGIYHWFKTRAVPMRNAEGNILKWFGSNTDIDNIKKAEEQLRKLNRIYSLLSDINQAIVRTHEPKELFEKICKISVEQGGFGMAWIGLIDESSQKLGVIAQAGRTNGYHEQVNISLKGKPLTYCPIDSALRQGKHNICKIIENEEMAPCQKIAYDLGFRSSASFPLKVSDILKGALTFYSDEPDFFDDAELKLLDELALDISFSMEYAEKEDERKRVEEALKASEERFRIAAETSNDVVYEWDLKEEVKWFGKIDEMLGYAPGEFPRTLDGLGASVYPEDWVRVMAAVQAHLEGRAPYAEDYRVLMKDGSFRWWSARGAVARTSDGNPVRWVGTVTDITERKRTEESLSDAELKFRTIFDKASDGMILAENGSSTFYMANNKICHMLGYTQKEILKIGLSDIHLKKDLPYVIKQFDRLMRNEISLVPDIPVLRKDGTVFYADINSSPVNLGGKDYLIGVFRDITERKIAEEKIKRLNDELEETVKQRTAQLQDTLEFNQKIINTSSLGIFACREDGPTIIANPAVAKISGTSVDQMLKINFRKLDSWKKNGLFRKVETALKTREEQRAEIHLTTVFGRDAWIYYYITTFRSGGKLHFLMTVDDITERKLAEIELKGYQDHLEVQTVQLEATNKELEAFSYSVSHDLRAPLRHVSGYVELLNKHFHSDLSEKGQHYLNSIADSVRVMGALIDDLLQFSRAGRIEMRQTHFDMNEIVKEVIESLRKDNPARKIEWVVGKLASVNGDEAMLRLVWINLLSNAVKFTRTKQKARIEIGVHKEKKELVFFVRDNGVGFDMQYAQKLFGVFQRLHPTEEFEGTGIGLANVHRIILRHGGRTWAEAEIDKGAVFYFSIPNK